MGSLGSAAFKAEADRNFGEALDVEVRLRDSANALVVLSDVENIIAVSPIVRRRERVFGVVEGTAVTVRFTHDGLVFNPTSDTWIDPAGTVRSLVLLWADVRIGFRALGEWLTVAQGRVERVAAFSDGSVEITIRDATMDLLRRKLPRHKAWTTTGWASFIEPVKVAASTATVTQAHTLVGANAAALGDLTYEIRFTAPTTYDLIHVDEPAYNQTGLSSLSSQSVLRVGAVAIVTLPAAVFSGTYAAGDVFRFDTSKQYAASALNPVTVLQEILSSVDGWGGLLKNVGTGATTLAVYGNGAVSSWATVAGRFSGLRIEGVWERGTDLVDLVQDILPGIQAALFPLTTGQIGIYHFHPDDAGAVGGSVTGEASDPARSLVKVDRYEDVADRANVARFRYRTLGAGEIGDERGNTDAEYEAPGAEDPFSGQRAEVSFSSAWEWSPAVIEAATNQTILRAQEPRYVYHVQGLLRVLLTHDLSEFLLLTEPSLSEQQRKVQVAEVSVDVFGNEVECIAFSDATVDFQYARINRTHVGDADVIY